MAVCRTCAEPVSWAKDPQRDNRKTMLEDIGLALVVNTKGEAVWARTYYFHRCDEADIERVRKRREQQTIQRQAYFESRDEAWRIADLRECPKCGAGSGEPCENLTERKKGNHKPTSWPHPERLPERRGVDVEE